jgi:AcrR family transcriptional regulator
MAKDVGATAVEAEREAPRSARGRRTRATLVAAARTVFERDGFLDARITDITKEAGVASGTFYTYFESKEEAFKAVVEEVQEDMLHPRLRERLGDEDPLALIDAANREYLLAYKRNARLMALFEQVAQIDDEFRELRRKRGAAFVRRNAKMIRRLQESGRADPDLDPLIAAHALSGMVGRIAYAVFNLGERIPFERLVTTLNQLWANALKLHQAPPRR